MTPIAVTFLVMSVLIVWGGLIVSALVLRRRPELDEYPAGGVDDHREDVGIVERDT